MRLELTLDSKYGCVRRRASETFQTRIYPASCCGAHEVRVSKHGTLRTSRHPSRGGPQDEVGVKPPTASNQNSDDCRSSVFGLRARLGGAFFPESVGAAAAAAIWSALSGSSRSGASFATRLTAGEIS